MITAGSGWQDEWALQEYVAGSWGESGSAGGEEGAHVWTDQPKTNHNPISIYFEISALWTCENVPRPDTIVTNVLSIKSTNTYSSCHFWKPPSPFKQALQDHCEIKHQLPKLQMANIFLHKCGNVFWGCSTRGCGVVLTGIKLEHSLSGQTCFHTNLHVKTFHCRL